MKTTHARTPGRPRTSTLSRPEQLRHAKRAQRERERRQGLVRYALKLPRLDAERLKAGMNRPEFVRRLRAFVREHVVAVADYDNLARLLWNRSECFVSDEEAFRLYERNWRFVDARRMRPEERELIARLANKYGNGVLNV